MNNEKMKGIKEKLKERYCYLDQAYSDHLAYGGKADEQQEEEISFLGDIRTLINEFESENERLKTEKQKVLEYMKTDNYAKLKKEDMCLGYQMGIGMLEHEIDRLKDRIAELETKNEVLCVELSRYTENCIEMKNGTLKQFAERLKENLEEYRLENEYFTKHEPNGNLWQMNSSVFCIEVTQDGGLVDETLKEFINERD